MCAVISTAKHVSLEMPYVFPQHVQILPWKPSLCPTPPQLLQTSEISCLKFPTTVTVLSFIRDGNNVKTFSI